MAALLRVRELVQTRRKAVGIRTQQQLADLVGVDRSHIAKIENGTIALPQPDLRRRLADVLGLSERDFLVAAGMLGEESTQYDVVAAPEEQRLRSLMLNLPPEDRTLLVDLAELLARRHRTRRT